MDGCKFRCAYKSTRLLPPGRSLPVFRRNSLAALFMLFIGWSSAQALDVTMAFGDQIPPFSFPETNSGIELDVIGEALAYRGHVLKPKYFPLARVPRMFSLGQVDAAMTDMGSDLTPSGAYYGDPAVLYDNVFISLRDRGLEIHTPEDLEGLSIISFQGADSRYPLWLEPVKRAGLYHSTNQQNLQVLTLFAGRYDLALADISIFKYFTRAQEGEKGLIRKPITAHRVFAMRHSDYRPVFRSSKVRDDFNAGLRHLRESGRFQAIYDYYLEGSELGD